MMITIEQALRPLLITCFILGLGAYPMKESNSRNQWIAHLSNLYRLTIWFSYACLFYYIVNLFTWKVLYQNNINVVIGASGILTTITSVVMSFYHQKRFETILKKLSAVNDSLEELGILKLNPKMHSYLKLMIIGWIMYSLAINFADTVWWTKEKGVNSSVFYLPCIQNYTVHINEFVELLFIYFLWHLHLELCRIASELNFIFGMQIIFGMATYLLQITALCCGLCVLLTQQMMPSFLWYHIIIRIFILLTRLYTVNYICESVMVKAKEIDKINLQLTNILRYADIRKEIYQFTLQVMHHPLKVTGMGLFYLGNVCLRKFCLTILTYVIIMVQMEVHVGPEIFNTFSKEKVDN